MKKKDRPESFRTYEYLTFGLATLLAMLLCIAAGSVDIPVGDTISAIGRAIWSAVRGLPIPSDNPIILQSRLPRVLCVAMCGAALSLCGAAMQGLLRNPLADGTTLGVSSGASLGAVVAIAFGGSARALSGLGTMGMAMLFAFLSLVVILSLAYRLDCTLSTNTIILIGIIYSMFMNSIISFIVTFAGEKVKNITFWMMGSFSGVRYANALTLLAALLVFGTGILLHTRELNAFAIGEDNARHVGVNVKRVKMTVLVCVAGLIGVCVSVSGTIGFVGLVIPHMTRMLVGPNHRRLLPANLFGGAIFLLLADLAARVMLRPLELPIGVVTSFLGSIAFILIFYRMRKGA